MASHSGFTRRRTSVWFAYLSRYGWRPWNPQFINGPEEIAFSRVQSNKSGEFTFAFDWYDSYITASLQDNSTLTGLWQKTGPGGIPSRLDFRAERVDTSARFVRNPKDGLQIAADSADTDFSGRWEVEFKDESGTESAEAIFEQNGDVLNGTFLTEVGDYRYLAGNVHGKRLRLSTFDGAHAFLFDAHSQSDGTLQGDFWSRDSYHATWTARPLAKDAPTQLGNDWELAKITSSDGRFRFSFPNEAGQTVSSNDAKFQKKPLIVNIFGSWCPNCNDKAPVLGAWQKKYRDQGLMVIGLAFEFTGDANRDWEVLRKFQERHGIDYEILLAGTNDKTAASQKLPDLSRVIAYPQTIFIGRDGKVRYVHTGFSGPGTGERHARLLEEMETKLQSILKTES